MATATHTLASVEEYLSTSYTPDMEYKCGKLIGRNVGTQNHSTNDYRCVSSFAAK
jgi:hypothetical protein